MYDLSGRLVRYPLGVYTRDLSYDAADRISVSVNGNPSLYTTAATTNKLTSITNPARSFGYDNTGNTTSDSAGYTATYDLVGRLTTLTRQGVTSTYTYDGSGKRVRKSAVRGRPVHVAETGLCNESEIA